MRSTQKTLDNQEIVLIGNRRERKSISGRRNSILKDEREGERECKMHCVQSGSVLLKWAARREKVVRDNFGKAGKG